MLLISFRGGLYAILSSCRMSLDCRTIMKTKRKVRQLDLSCDKSRIDLAHDWLTKAIQNS